MAAPSIPRQQRRKMRRDLLERGEKALARGLPQPTGNEDALAIALALLTRLEDEREANRASRLADAAEALLDKTMGRDLKGLSYACRKGCGWCCWQRVTCTAPEIFRVAEWMRANAGRPGVPTIATMTAAEASDAGFVATAQPGNQRPCALLLDNACGIHPGRPISCRAVLSMSAEACRKAMLDPTTADPVPLVVGAMDSAEAVRTLMLAAVSAKGLDDSGFDLIDALKVVLPDADAEKRWLAGENVLAGVRSGQRAPDARAAQIQIAGMLRSLAEA